MKRLLDAIVTAFAADATCTTAFPGGLHLLEAPPDADLPYLVMVPFADPATWAYGGNVFTDTSIQFTGRAVGASTALAAVESFTGVFDSITLTLANSKQHFFVRRTGGAIPEPQDPTPDEQARPTYGWIVTYDFASNG